MAAAGRQRGDAASRPVHRLGEPPRAVSAWPRRESRYSRGIGLGAAWPDLAADKLGFHTVPGASMLVRHGRDGGPPAGRLGPVFYY